MIEKRKISEMPETNNVEGLYSLGVNAENESVKFNIKDTFQSAIAGAAAAGTAPAIAAANAAANAANSAASNANNAAQIASAAASNANVQAQRAEDAADFVEGSVNAQLQKSQYAVPTAMAIDYPAEITIGNNNAVLLYTITPANAMRNVIFYKGTDKNDAVLAVHPLSGALTPIAAGTAHIYVIPTANTGIYKSCTIAVRAPETLLDYDSIPLADHDNQELLV